MQNLYGESYEKLLKMEEETQANRPLSSRIGYLIKMLVLPNVTLKIFVIPINMPVFLFFLEVAMLMFKLIWKKHSGIFRKALKRKH